jgi:hypothetical protein
MMRGFTAKPFTFRPWRFLKMSLIVVLAATVCYGCSSLGPPGDGGNVGSSRAEADASIRLEQDLAGLLGYRDDETRRLAQILLACSERLAREYRVQRPALWHNLLVNMGIRDRGLCCHWTQDLLLQIDAMDLRKYQAAWGVSRHGTWREHSCVVITAGEQTFENGLVVDAWRNGGRLYWVPVADDSYAWQPHPGDGGTARIRCR